jgi:hypothetical protein
MLSGWGAAPGSAVAGDEGDDVGEAGGVDLAAADHGVRLPVEAPDADLDHRLAVLAERGSCDLEAGHLGDDAAVLDHPVAAGGGEHGGGDGEAGVARRLDRVRDGDRLLERAPDHAPHRRLPAGTGRPPSQQARPPPRRRRRPTGR